MISYSDNLVSLEHLKPSERGSVVQLLGCPEETRRLAEMGLSVGSSIRMVRRGSPCLVAIGEGGGKRLSLRLNEGLEVWVALEPQS